MQALNGDYFKPVQAGLEDPTDTEVVQQLTGLDRTHFMPELYRLRMPASPHIAARLDGQEIDVSHLRLPQTGRPLIVEGAGGVLVPLTDEILYADVFAKWNAPVILCARTSLGTINHSLLSIEALKSRSVPVLGIAFVGDENGDMEETIVKIGKVRKLGRLPWLRKLDRQALAEAFKAGFDLETFIGGLI